MIINIIFKNVVAEPSGKLTYMATTELEVGEELVRTDAHAHAHAHTHTHTHVHAHTHAIHAHAPTQSMHIHTCTVSKSYCAYAQVQLHILLQCYMCTSINNIINSTLNDFFFFIFFADIELHW